MLSPIPDRSHGIPRPQARAAVGPGWARLVGRAYDAIEAHGAQLIDAKEKYGALRLYCVPHPVPDRLRRRLAAVERLSLHICEVCGRRGALRDDNPWDTGWV